jgi:hypothetical protein
MFNRTIRMLEAGVKPVYVFDGKPPTMKSGEVRDPDLRTSVWRQQGLRVVTAPDLGHILCSTHEEWGMHCLLFSPVC